MVIKKLYEHFKRNATAVDADILLLSTFTLLKSIKKEETFFSDYLTKKDFQLACNELSTALPEMVVNAIDFTRFGIIPPKQTTNRCNLDPSIQGAISRYLLKYKMDVKTEFAPPLHGRYYLRQDFAARITHILTAYQLEECATSIIGDDHAEIELISIVMGACSRRRWEVSLTFATNVFDPSWFQALDVILNIEKAGGSPPTACEIARSGNISQFETDETLELLKMMGVVYLDEITSTYRSVSPEAEQSYLEDWIEQWCAHKNTP